MRVIMICIMLITLGISSVSVTEATAPPAGISNEAPQWVTRAKIALSEAYWGEGDYIVAVGSATRMLDVLHQKRVAVYRAKENVLRALGIIEALLVNTEITGVWKDPSDGTIYARVRIHKDNIFPSDPNK